METKMLSTFKEEELNELLYKYKKLPVVIKIHGEQGVGIIKIPESNDFIREGSRRIHRSSYFILSDGKIINGRSTELLKKDALEGYENAFAMTNLGTKTYIFVVTNPTLYDLL